MMKQSYFSNYQQTIALLHALGLGYSVENNDNARLIVVAEGCAKVEAYPNYYTYFAFNSETLEFIKMGIYEL